MILTRACATRFDTSTLFFSKNSYSAAFVKHNTYRPNDQTDKPTDRPKPATTATIPYIKGTSETIARILQPYNIRVAHKPTVTLRRLLTNVKDRTSPLDRQGTIYKVNCNDCTATYIGETGRNLNTRLKEHKRATAIGDKTNNIAEHVRQTRHTFDWDSAHCINFSTNWQQRLVLESWYTNFEQRPLNRSQQIPAPYRRLLDATTKNRRITHNFQQTNQHLTSSHNQSHSSNNSQQQPIRQNQDCINTLTVDSLATALWWWLPHRWPKRQSQTVFFKTTSTRKITLPSTYLHLGSNLSIHNYSSHQMMHISQNMYSKMRFIN